MLSNKRWWQVVFCLFVRVNLSSISGSGVSQSIGYVYRFESQYFQEVGLLLLSFTFFLSLSLSSITTSSLIAVHRFIYVCVFVCAVVLFYPMSKYHDQARFHHYVLGHVGVVTVQHEDGLFSGNPSTDIVLVYPSVVLAGLQ